MKQDETKTTSPRAPSPADKVIEAEGGEILPEEWRSQGIKEMEFDEIRPVIEEVGPGPSVATDGPVARVMGVRGGVLDQNGPLPPGVSPPPAPSKEELEFRNLLDRLVNFELNVFNTCYSAVRNFVAFRLATEPPDSAELGQSLFGPGKRTPLEEAEPQIALEVYRNVREGLRSAATPVG